MKNFILIILFSFEFAFGNPKTNDCENLLKEVKGIWKNKYFSICICSINQPTATIKLNYYENKYSSYSDIQDVISENGKIQFKAIYDDGIERDNYLSIFTIQKLGKNIEFSHKEKKLILVFNGEEPFSNPNLKYDLPSQKVKEEYNIPKEIKGIWENKNKQTTQILAICSNEMFLEVLSRDFNSKISLFIDVRSSWYKNKFIIRSLQWNEKKNKKILSGNLYLYSKKENKIYMIDSDDGFDNPSIIETFEKKEECKR